MSISLMKEVWDNSNAFGSDLLALLCLADQANEQGACWPSIALIGKRCRLSGRQVARLLKKLEDAKHITRVERPGHSNFYYVHPVGMTPVSPVTDQSPLTPVSPTPDMDVIPPLTPVSPRTVKEPSKNPKTNVQSVPEGFDSFWSTYPRRQAKLDAMRAFAKLHPDSETIKTMIRAIGVQKQTEQWKKGINFVPLPATWLNGRRWEDEIGTSVHQPTLEELKWGKGGRIG